MSLDLKCRSVRSSARRALVAGFAFLPVVAIAAVTCSAQQGLNGSAAPRSSGPPDISGFWELPLDGRNVPPAELVPGITKQVLDAQAKKDEKAIRWCNTLGLPFAAAPGRPLDIRQDKYNIIIASESYAAPRHIYLERAEHISKDLWDATPNGDSIAHFEGDTLVVDTIGFATDKGITAIPGGGIREASSHLIERYRLVEDGSVLSVTFTWEDPKMYRKPHTYEFRYFRLPKEYEPEPTHLCDPYDDERTAFLTGVPGAPSTAKPAASLKP